jgi:hypothetical protein
MKKLVRLTAYTLRGSVRQSVFGLDSAVISVILLPPNSGLGGLCGNYQGSVEHSSFPSDVNIGINLPTFAVCKRKVVCLSLKQVFPKYVFSPLFIPLLI